MFDVAIIGSGPAGISSAINCKIRNKSIVLFGQNELSHKVEISEKINNYPGLPNISGKELNAKMREHLDSMGIEITEERITGIYNMKDKFTLLANRKMFEARSVILCLGAETIKPLPNERELLGRGVSYCATCDGMLYKDKKIAVFCDNADGEEEVEYLSDLASEVYYSHKFTSKIDKANVTHLKSRITAVIGDGKVSGIELADDTNLDVDGVFFIKQAVSADVLLNKLEVQNGSIVVDKNMKTSIDGCFAAGDCTG
ncbi:MAG: NAD(P)/FAD-dependent oxidoreductase, partial [Eubacterium coprostanoligenes]|nr:NAD(P)/FAD-dependent oxidoreductase [Eubacterium coprostanoligenes]